MTKFSYDVNHYNKKKKKKKKIENKINKHVINNYI